MDTTTQAHRDHRFAIGLMAGTCIGAGLMMWLAPKAASELRRRMKASAKSLGERAVEQYGDASTRVGAAVGELARGARGIRDDVARSVARGALDVARGAHEVERIVMSTTDGPR